MKIFGKTDVGLKRRSNQDSFAVLEKGSYALAVVCDGVGGANGGETASDTAIRVFCQSVRSSLKSPDAFSDARGVEDILSQAVSEANAEVFRKAQEDPELEGMGTTLVAALLHGPDVFVVNVGDSRLYALEKNGSLRQVTVDHSFVQYLIDRGLISPEEAKTHPNRNIILRSLGNTEEVQPDIFRLQKGEFRQLLLCSDGLYNMIEPNVLYAVASGTDGGRKRPPRPRKRVAELIRLANRGGGVDNITAVLITEDGF